MTTNETKLFSSLTIQSITFKNRIWVSPMCQYSSENGHPTEWHFVHLGSRAVGGAGLVMVEATAVSPEGRISPGDSGIWSDDHVAGFRRITDFMKGQGSVSGIQLAHAGRKASTSAPWIGDKVLGTEEGGWETLAPSPISFEKGNVLPREMTRDDMVKVIHDFESSTKRSLAAGFQVVELHMAHGYLMHEFLSPISNQRKDEYGGSLENRMRFPLEVASAVRKLWPRELPLFARISATDWAKDIPSWTLEDSIILSRRLKDLGVDLIDCSTGGTLEHAEIPVGPGYQVPFAETIRKEAGILTAAVGMITEPAQAEAILQESRADAIFMARGFLRDPYWPLHAARALGVKVQGPKQYGRS